mgnify:FL=1|jgi:dTDP-glucose 4,6-dehydratase
MRKILITGGTTFVSRYAAEYFVKKGDDVYVLNRNNSYQSEGVTLIEGDRHQLGDKLKHYEFDAVLDITAYTREDIRDLLEALGSFSEYLFISSSAVYPETLKQPFKEEQPVGFNSVWQQYGMDKIEAEQYLLEKVPHAYVIRPPYLYGPMQNVYREPFVFDCALEKRPFYLPGDGEMKLQFFHVEDLCRFLEVLLEKQPEDHIFNVGNPEMVTIKDWARLCYDVVGEEFSTISVDEKYEQRSYFCFYDYTYELDVKKQQALLPETKSLYEGLQESYEWYCVHEDEVKKKPFFEIIDQIALFPM